MAGKHKSTTVRKRRKREKDVQDGHITEENAYEQRADRGGYYSAVHAPRWWLLENTRPSRTRREQVTTKTYQLPRQTKVKERWRRTPTASRLA